MDSAIGNSVRIRNLERADLPQLFQMQLDRESNQLAATIPLTAEAFASRWADNLQNAGIVAKAILLDGVLAGNIVCFERDGQTNVGYWIGREHWGQGVATEALRLLLHEVAVRPLHAYVATDNGASLRVLQKCGFVVERVQLSPGSDRYLECEETVLILKE
jgi:RimJ/RimL family protein N-acetyltransferase